MKQAHLNAIIRGLPSQRFLSSVDLNAGRVPPHNTEKELLLIGQLHFPIHFGSPIQTQSYRQRQHRSPEPLTFPSKSKLELLVPGTKYQTAAASETETHF